MGSTMQADQNNDAEGDGPVETDPTGRFQRCDEILGEGAYKLVYRAFDQEEGVEVAWNQLRLDHLSKKEAQKILSEIEILQSIRNEHIINFYESWSTKSPSGGERIVFVTELMSSGTLKQYLRKTLKGPLKPKVLKSWCRQILHGLVYLHTHDPPIIHRDLKCDNIFINGNNGQLKIGDLGLAVVRHRTHVSSVLGTPEFMAPELYDEKYDEKVDIYAFGMCVLEMVTKEYPYSECTNQAQIYRKVTLGIKPKSLDLVQDPETRSFIDRCLDHDDRTRPSAQELLDSDFLKPCLVIPPAAGLCRLEYLDSPSGSAGTSSPRSSQVEPYFTFSSSSTPAPTSTPAPIPSPIPAPVPSSSITPPSSAPAASDSITPALNRPQPLTIPTTAFTTSTTVDADNKTYHIRSNLIPHTPISSTEPPSHNSILEQEPPTPAALHQHQPLPQLQVATAQHAVSEIQLNNQALAMETPTLHSHNNTRTCSIQVVSYEEMEGSQLNLKMICTCPVAGPRDVTVPAGTHEIKFPFDTSVDTVEEVVAEMVREQILSADDRAEAVSKIHEVVDAALAKATLKLEQSISKNQELESHGQQTSHHNVDHTNKMTSTKNGHHRQLNVPPAGNMDQYGTSPTDTYYDHYSSVGSNASLGWNSAESPEESDQGYGTVPRKPPQLPPVITESTFPPLSSTEPLQSKSATAPHNTAAETDKMETHTTYSDVLQHQGAGHHPLSPSLIIRERTISMPNASSMHELGYEVRDPALVASQDSRLLNDALAKDTPLRELDTKSSVTRVKAEAKEDVGYTSPYRHGISGSSINYHRRSPSVDLSALVAPSSETSITKTPILSRESSTRSVAMVSQQEGGSSLVLQGKGEVLPFHVSVQATVNKNLNGQVQSQTQTVGTTPLYPDHHPFSLKPMSEALDMSPPLSSEARRNIELWSDRIPSPEHAMNSGANYINGSNYSSCPEMSEDEDPLDEDLKTLREKQRLELELMRRQHEEQWEKMMKLKEQKVLQEKGVRRKSDGNEIQVPVTLPPSASPAH
ncbi:Serine/threonine-protein kinase wnk3 [Lunasporangiospora selenospora]|uniref:non-specific serine/threonine protein kinase n=1 Tax=Lunasporangiospora selenospora TaxID=979761 RepID=A0A9P6G4N0_9FUNG|nr:Serine/threonine-protein kinase wnk3 [Lunasporangiospora selenospora]